MSARIFALTGEFNNNQKEVTPIGTDKHQVRTIKSDGHEKQERKKLEFSKNKIQLI